MKIAYTVFHSTELSQGFDRSINVKQIKDALYGYADYIDSEVFLVKTLKDYKNIKKEKILFRGLKFNGRFMLGATGLIFTTFNFFNKIKNLDYDYFIIIEDDAEPNPDIVNNLNNYISQLPQDADVLSLYENNFFYKQYNPKIHDVGLKDLCLVYNRLSTLGYVVSNKGVQKYLEIMTEVIKEPIDLLLFDSKKSTVQFAIKPTSPQVFSSGFFRKDNGEPIDEFSNINQTEEVLFNE